VITQTKEPARRPMPACSRPWPPARAARPAAAAPLAVQAHRHLPDAAARLINPANRPHPFQLQGRPHRDRRISATVPTCRTSQEERPRARDPQRPSCDARPALSSRRLQPDRAARARPPSGDATLKARSPARRHPPLRRRPVIRASPRRRSRRSSATPPRRSTSASSTARPPSACRSSSASRAGRRSSSSTATSRVSARCAPTSPG